MTTRAESQGANSKTSDPASVRHAEKRRVSTCKFADRVARFCVDHYMELVPLAFRSEQKQTCLAAIVALVQQEKAQSQADESKLPLGSSEGRLYMLGMGVGTKFLAKDLLLQIMANNDELEYGRRVRDCHAEVLARRAFRRQLNLCMLRDLDPGKSEPFSVSEDTCPPIVERIEQEDGTFLYRLSPEVSLHMYTSSAPCGNATVSLLNRTGTVFRAYQKQWFNLCLVHYFFL